jgi:hypothetical protein
MTFLHWELSAAKRICGDYRAMARDSSFRLVDCLAMREGAGNSREATHGASRIGSPTPARLRMLAQRFQTRILRAFP